MPANKLSVQIVYVKEGDEWVESVTVPDSFSGDISAYTSWSCQLMDDSVLTADVSSAVASGAVVVLDNEDRTIQITVDDSQTDNLVASGSNTRDLYADVSADISGSPRTVAEMLWTVTRKYKTT